MKQYTIDQLNDLLNRACDIITSLEGYANEHPDYHRNEQKIVDAFFNEIDYMNEEDTGPEYDSAGFTEEDRIVDGQYRVIIGRTADDEAQDFDTFGEKKV